MSTDIKMIRGTTFEQDIHITYEDKDYNLQSGEVLRFGVKENGQQRRYLIIKEWKAQDVRNGLFVLKIEPSDTLKLPYKKYKYDLGIQRGEDYFMLIPESDFLLCENITQWEERE